MPVNLKMDATTLAEVLAATTVNARITALKTAMGTGTQTVSIKNDSAVEKLTATFAGTAYSDSAADFIPRTALSSISGTGGTATTDWTLRITNGSSRWIEAEFGTGETWTATKALDSADATYLTLNLGWQAPTGGGVTIVESMARSWLDPVNLFSTHTTSKRRTLYRSFLAPGKLNGSLSDVPNAGLAWTANIDGLTADNQMRLQRVANGSSWVYRTSYYTGEPLDYFGTRRFVLMSNDDTQYIPLGEEHWVAFSFKTPSVAPTCSGVIAGMSAYVPGGESCMYWYHGSSQSVSYGVWYNEVLNGDRNNLPRDPITGDSRAGTGSPLTYYQATLGNSEWQSWVLKVRFGYDSSFNPSTQLWHRKGSAAIPSAPVVSGTWPNSWNMEYPPSNVKVVRPYIGEYFFGSGLNPWGNGSPLHYDIGGMIVVPVSAAPGATHTDFFNWLAVRTGV